MTMTTRKMLALVAGLLAAAGAAVAQGGGRAARRCVVTDYGAVADGATVNTKAIQGAIDKCAAAGGGTLVVPKGTFLSGAIFLKQGVNLLVEKDGVLKGTTNIDDYPQIKTRWEGTEEMWTSAFVNAEGLTDLTISGEGTIDGSGEEWVLKNPYRRPAAAGSAGATGTGDAAGAATTAAVPAGPPVQRRGAAAADRDSELEAGADCGFESA